MGLDLADGAKLGRWAYDAEQVDYCTRRDKDATELKDPTYEDCITDRAQPPETARLANGKLECRLKWNF